MTDEELKAIEAIGTAASDAWDVHGMLAGIRGQARLAEQVPTLVAEVRRLRGLIKKAEWSSREQTGCYCPWCDHYADGKHTDCPAFTESGEVR